MARSDDPEGASRGRPPDQQRIFTVPLVLFLGAVAAVVGSGLWSRWRVPDAREAVLLLADGDLDGSERSRVLRILVAAGLQTEDAEQRWAALLAAVVLEDRQAHDQLLAALGGMGERLRVPGPAERELLHLGDPMLGNVLEAMVAEAAADREGARLRWQQVATQSNLMGRPFAAELAAAAARRLG